MCELDKLTGSDRNRCKRLLRDHCRDSGLLLDQGIKSGDQGSAAGKNDSTVEDIGREFRWGTLQYIVYSVYNLHRRLS